MLDPRLTNSVGLSQIATLTYNRLLRYPFTDEAKGSADLTLIALARHDTMLVVHDPCAMMTGAADGL